AVEEPLAPAGHLERRVELHHDALARHAHDRPRLPVLGAVAGDDPHAVAGRDREPAAAWLQRRPVGAREQGHRNGAMIAAGAPVATRPGFCVTCTSLW